MKLLIVTVFLVILILDVEAQNDPRSISFHQEYLANKNLIAKDTSKSIVVYGARDDNGLYKVQGVDRPLTFKELEKLLSTFFRDFPQNAKSKSKGFEGSPVPKPNILYMSLSWAEVKNDGRDLVLKIAKRENVSLFFFTVNPNYTTIRRKGDLIPDHMTAIIDYYDNRLLSTSLASVEKTKAPSKPARSNSLYAE